LVRDYKSFNESKYYGDLYHNLRSYPQGSVSIDYQEIFKTLRSICDYGLKFNKNPISDNSRIKGRFKFLVGDYFISVTRDKKTIDNFGVSFVLDGEKISERYKIEPFNLNCNVDIKVSKYLKSHNFDGDWKENPVMFGYKSPIPNSRYWSEEKIISKSPGYLSPKYFKKIVINRPSEIFFGLLKELETDIEILIR
jgi:hypothetical protein